MAKKNYYHLLGVSPWASAAEIESAYKNKARQIMEMHTDQKEHFFNLLMDAYSTLKDPERRKAYDQTLPLKNKNRLSVSSTKDNPNSASSPPSFEERPTFTQLMDFNFEALEEPAPDTPAQKKAYWDAILFKILVFSIFIAVLVLIFWAVN
jgi:DnaJ-class molecular chaperone